MTTITTRSGKGSPLTNDEVDANFTGLNSDKVEASGDSMTGDLSFGDNNKAIFGAGSDLQIFHDGVSSTSYFIESNATGNMEFRASGLRLKEGDGGNYYFLGVAGGSSSIYHNGSKKLETTSTGIDVTGNIINSGHLLHNNNSGLKIIGGGDATNDGSNLTLYGSTNASAGTFRFRNGTATHLEVAGNGDISFYEDTGTTEKLVWKSADERLGIGTSIPQFDLQTVNGGLDSRGAGAGIAIRNNIYFDSSDKYLTASGAASTQYFDGSGNIIFYNTGTASTGAGNAVSLSERMRIEHSGTVKISHADTASEGLRVIQTTSARTSGGSLGLFYDDQSGTTQPTLQVIQNGTGDILQLFDGGTQAVTVQDGGNLLVGKTATTFSTEGIVAFSSADSNGSRVNITNDGGEALNLNRKTSDGNIAIFYKDGATVGSIGTKSSSLLLGTGAVGLWFVESGDDRIIPRNTTGSAADASIDLGDANSRFKDIYASNGTIQTSDRNEKQDIEALSEAEQRVAVTCKGLLRKFRWKDAVADKGDEARIHFGIIAQDLQDAFTAEGLDAGRYGMFISTTWTDEETGEERTRMGVRYSELLAFIIAAI